MDDHAALGLDGLGEERPDALERAAEIDVDIALLELGDRREQLDRGRCVEVTR